MFDSFAQIKTQTIIKIDVEQQQLGFSYSLQSKEYERVGRQMKIGLLERDRPLPVFCRASYQTSYPSFAETVY